MYQIPNNSTYPGKLLHENAKNIYHRTIEDVMRELKDLFLDNELHDDTIEMIKAKWQKKLFEESGVFDRPSPKPKNYNLNKNSSRTNPLVAL